jgi:hypothetical protein
MLTNEAIGFLFEGFIGLGRWDVFVPSPFRGRVFFRFAFPFCFGRHRTLGLNAPQQTHQALIS